MRHPFRNDAGFREWLVVERSCGNSHRFGGPAIEWDNGSKMWFWKGDLRGEQDGTGGNIFFKDRSRPKFSGDGPFPGLRFPGYKQGD